MIIDHPLLGPRDSTEFTYWVTHPCCAGLIGKQPMQRPSFMTMAICATIRRARIGSFGITNKGTGHGWS